MTKKITAYGSVVVAALVMGFALLTAASAAPSVGDGSVTITGDDTQTLKATDANQGFLTGVPADGSFTIVTQPATGGSVSVTTEGTTAIVTTMVDNAAGSGTGATIVVDSTADFPSSGHFFIDNGANIDDTDNGLAGLDVADEIISCTGKTSTSLTGCTRGVGNTSPVDHPDNTPIYPIVYSVIAIDELVAGDTTVNLADNSAFATSGRIVSRPVDADIGAAEAMAYTGKSGSSLIGIAATEPDVDPNAVGTDIIQFGRTVDTATIDIDVDSGFSGSFTYEFDYDLVAGDSTITVTVIDDNPVANDVEATVSATLPTPLPVIIILGGSDASSVSSTPSLNFTALPTKGLLSTTTPTLGCTNVSGAVIGEILTNCTTQLVYTPLAGATGTDTFTYTITNGGDTSAEATVTVVLPGGSPTPSPGGGFGTALVTGVNLTTYNGGTLAQLATDAAAANATSVSVTAGGAFLVHVVGAPDFVNAAFAANFPSDVPAGTVVLVLVSS